MKSSPVAGASRAGAELTFRPSRAQPPRPQAPQSTPKPCLSSKPAPAAVGKLQPSLACHHCPDPNTEMRGHSSDPKRTTVRRNSTSAPAPQSASPGTAHLYGTRQGRNGRSRDPTRRVEAIIADGEGVLLPKGRPEDKESTVADVPDWYARETRHDISAPPPTGRRCRRRTARHDQSERFRDRSSVMHHPAPCAGISQVHDGRRPRPIAARWFV
jgi:hypothetical protein